MPHRKIYSWNIIIGEFSRSGSPENSIELFLQMRNSEVRPDAYTLPLVLRGVCRRWAEEFRSFGTWVLREDGCGEEFVASALAIMYVTFREIFDARNVFDEMPQRDAVLWTSMLAGHAQHEEPMLALSVYRS